VNCETKGALKVVLKEEEKGSLEYLVIFFLLFSLSGNDITRWRVSEKALLKGGWYLIRGCTATVFWKYLRDI